MFTAAAFITLNEKLSEKKVYFTEVHHVFAFQTLFSYSSHIFAGLIQED